MASLTVVACPDKFRGTATATQAAAAITAASKAESTPELSFIAQQLPMADGGEGTLEALGGPNRTTRVTGPLGQSVDAEWRLEQGGDTATAISNTAVISTAVIEMARASGLQLADGVDHNDPIAATTHGTGQLIAEAIAEGAKRIIVSLGGSATTDGGLGALEALQPLNQLRDVQLIAACDVQTKFTDAAEVFGPQKGATPAQVQQLRQRLTSLADAYQQQYGVDVTNLARAGAAGGLAGALAVCGAELVSGFELVSQEVGLPQAISDAGLVVTGEGLLDGGSFDGKVVGAVAELAAASEVPLLIVAGACDEAGLQAAGRYPQTTAVSLTETFGETRALDDTLACIQQVVSDYLRS